uniref:U4/U6.U5 small nuclear ribonucleoprotein 27 kDa protein n=3 Tax=Boreoeutheria TaxID=1437010 RepID=A0A096N3Y0_PAPAN
MGRSRSRSPRRERRRSRSTSRERERRRRERSRSRERDRRRSRSRSPHRRRSRSPRRHRSTSPSPSRLKERRDEEKKETKETKSKERQITEEDLEGKTEEEIEMMKLMGFASFDSTKGKKVDGSVNAYAINVSQKRKYRQYMNRKGNIICGRRQPHFICPYSCGSSICFLLECSLGLLKKHESNLEAPYLDVALLSEIKRAMYTCFKTFGISG